MMLNENEELEAEEEEPEEVLDENGNPLTKLEILRMSEPFKVNRAEIMKI